MSISGSSVRHVLRGDDSSGEIFATGFWMRPPSGTPATQVALNTMNDDVALSFLATAINGFRSIMASTSHYTGVTSYMYNGGDTALLVAEHEFTPVQGVGQGGNSLPLQTSMCLSLRTDVPGRSGRGRMYLPAHGSTLTVHQFPTADVENVVTAAQAFFEDIDGDGVAGTVIVASETLDMGNAVNAVEVDSRPDIQRRRANRQTIRERQRLPVGIV